MQNEKELAGKFDFEIGEEDIEVKVGYSGEKNAVAISFDKEIRLLVLKPDVALDLGKALINISEKMIN